MYKVLSADKDAYITDRFVRTLRVVSGNTGDAATLDLFKLYGMTTSGSVGLTELSRLLVHFDLDPIRTLISASLIDTADNSFKCTMKLFDVYGGQPTPQNFKVVVHPLSRSFDEGYGRDIVHYGDHDVCNFLSGSRADGAWVLSGANAGGGNGTTVDYLTYFVDEGTTASLESSQTFVTGEEDLSVDVTLAVSAALANLIPDSGFRIALTASLEDDSHSYFVKRFASRHAYNADKHPKLFVQFDDSISDDSTNLRLDTSASITFYNYGIRNHENLTSGSSIISGSSCLLLKLVTPISGGEYQTVFTASQVNMGSIPRTGIYSASVYIDSTNTYVNQHLVKSGSVSFTPIWGSIDGTYSYHTGSKVTFNAHPRGLGNISTNRYNISVTKVPVEMTTTDVAIVKVNIQDAYSTTIVSKRVPISIVGTSVRDVHYRIRDLKTNKAIFDFDETLNSTRVSSDHNGMFFKLDASMLTPGHQYVIDILVSNAGEKQLKLAASNAFKVVQ